MANNKSMEFGTWTMSDIIENRYFRVPDYQRGYAWSKRQLEEFWEDINVVVESGHRHYTGAITVEKAPCLPLIASREGLYVVDGQQRMTTVAILLSVFKKDDSPFVFEQNGHRQSVFSYGEGNDDQSFFEQLLLGEELGAAANSHQRNLKFARDFFLSKAGELNQNQKSRVSETIMRQLAFDFRVLGGDFEAGVVFETMNNRGKPLTILEKLKNRLMYLAGTLKSNASNESERREFEVSKDRTRQDINEAWREIYRRLASAPDADPLDEDEFVAAHLSVYRNPKESVYSESVAESRLFKMFCDHPERYPKSEDADVNDARAGKEEPISLEKIRDYIGDIQKFVKPWADVHADFDGPIGRCRLLSGKREVKIFLASVLLHAQDETVRNSIFDLTETIIFRNSVLKKAGIDDRFARLARRLHGECLAMMRRGDNREIDAAGVRDILRSDLADRCQVTPEILKKNFGDGFYEWSGLKYFLFRFEEEIRARGTTGLPWTEFENVSLEHVIPQSAAKEDYDGWWKRQIDQFAPLAGPWDGLSREERRRCNERRSNLVNSLGNFVLLTKSENSSVSDDPWEGYAAVEGSHRAVVGKRDFYRDGNHTSSALARDLANRYECWNAYRVRERGRILFRRMAEYLGVAGLSEALIDEALCFDDVQPLEDMPFGALPDDEVRRLAPRLGIAPDAQIALTEQQKRDFLIALQERIGNGTVNCNVYQFYPNDNRRLYFEIRNNKAVLIFRCENEAARNAAWNAHHTELEQTFPVEAGEINHEYARNPEGSGDRYIRFIYNIFPGPNDANIFEMMRGHYEVINRILLG